MRSLQTSVPIPSNETSRVAALREYGILDTGRDPIYDTFATLAAAICETPIALVSFVDTSRQWFKANVGLPGVSETSRSDSFCAHSVASSEMLEVEDATLDVRFADNPLVTGDPTIRFYAGAPLIDRAGNALGTICAIDRRPKVLTSRQRDALVGVAAALVNLIEARRGVSTETFEQLSLLSAALESAPLPMVLMRTPPKGEPPIISFANRAFTELFGYAVSEVVGRSPRMLHGPQTDESRIARLQNAAEGRESGTEIVVFSTANGSARTVEVRARQVNETHRIVSFRDLTRLNQTQEALSNANQRLYSLLTHNNDAVLTIDRHGACFDVNASAIKLFGRSREQLLGSGFFAQTGRGVFPSDEPFPARLLAGEPLEFAAHFELREGRALDIECKAIPMMVGGVTEGAYVIAKDVTERRRLMDLVTEQANRTHALYLISATKASAESEQIDAAIRLATDSFAMELGYVGEICGDVLTITNRSGAELFPVGHTIALERTVVADAVASGDVLSVADINDPALVDPEKVARYPNLHGYIAAPLVVEGSVFGVLGILSRRVIAFTDFDRQFMRLVAALVSTLLERQAQQQRLDRLAFYDHLTALPNRAKFMSALGESVADGVAGTHVFALHCIDLDGFKALNDSAGHSVGDLALVEVGRRLQSIVRPYDLPARLGGDEFVLLQNHVARRADCIALGKRIVTLLSEPYELDGIRYSLSASVGVALFGEDGSDAKTLLRHADAALYRAKELGKNRVAFVSDFSSAMRSEGLSA